MKKFTKVCLLTALVFVILGSICLGIGIGYSGGTVIQEGLKVITDDENIDDFSKVINHLNLNWSSMKHWKDYRNHSNAFDTCDTYTISGNHLQSLSLDIDCGAIEFTEDTSATDIQVEIKYNSYEQSFQYSDDKAGNVTIENKQKHSGINVHGGKILITLPGNCTIEDLDLKNNTGELLSDGSFTINHCSIDIDCGNVELGCLQAQEITIHNGTGNVEIDYVDVSSSLQISIATGNLNLNLKGCKEDYNYDLNNDLGELTINNHNKDGFGNHFTENNNSNVTIKATCNLGNLEIGFKND